MIGAGFFAGRALKDNVWAVIVCPIVVSQSADSTEKQSSFARMDSPFDFAQGRLRRLSLRETCYET